MGGSVYPPISTQQTDPYGFIESVTINSDGTGVLWLKNFDYVKSKVLPCQEFETFDYGVSWLEME